MQTQTTILVCTLAVCTVVVGMWWKFCGFHHKKPSSMDNIQFGTVFSNHMFVMEWTPDKGWHNQRIQTYQAFSLDPASVHMHYGQEIFEGMKAFAHDNNSIALFRPRDHLARFNRSAKIMCMPEIDTNQVLSWLKKLIAKDRKWVPREPGTALYIRPSMIATEKTINLKPASKYVFFIILSPVGSLYKEGFNPVGVMVSTEFTRSSVGGVGEAKTGGNYAASMRAQQEASKKGFSQVLWLDPVHREFVEEVGSMNIFFVFDNEIVTPALTGTILPGITRRTVLEMCKQQNISYVERSISIKEVIAGIESGKLKEIFGTGTAAGIAPVGKLEFNGRMHVVNNNQTGPVTRQIYDMLTSIQYGKKYDSSGWIEVIK